MIAVLGVLSLFGQCLACGPCVIWQAYGCSDSICAHNTNLDEGSWQLGYNFNLNIRIGTFLDYDSAGGS